MDKFWERERYKNCKSWTTREWCTDAIERAQHYIRKDDGFCPELILFEDNEPFDIYFLTSDKEKIVLKDYVDLPMQQHGNGRKIADSFLFLAEAPVWVTNGDTMEKLSSFQVIFSADSEAVAYTVVYTPDKTFRSPVSTRPWYDFEKVRKNSKMQYVRRARRVVIPSKMSLLGGPHIEQMI